MAKHQTRPCSAQAGFTLVELAIVMIIIGLLIAGVLKGQALIANAQITTTVAQMKSIEAATTTFKDQYGSIPGDLTNANTRITNCAGVCYIAGATGDGILSNTPIVTPIGKEGEAFFLQLFNTSLLTGLAPQPGDVTSPNVGVNFPATKIGGGVLQASYAATAANYPALYGTNAPQNGLYLSISGGPTIGVPSATPGLTGPQAGAIDTKIDDGQPDAGTVWAVNANACGTAGAGATPGYYNASSNPTCTIFERIQN